MGYKEEAMNTANFPDVCEDQWGGKYLRFEGRVVYLFLNRTLFLRISELTASSLITLFHILQKY